MTETNETASPLDQDLAWKARAARRAQMREKKKQQRLITAVVLIILLAAVIFLAVAFIRGGTTEAPTSPVTETAAETATTLPPETEPPTLPPMTWMNFEEDRPLTAAHYFVYDADAERFLTISGMLTDRIYPASVTKLFTAYVALQYLDLDREITAGSALELVDPESSIADIRYGETLKAETLVEAMLLPSGNDAACILAVEVGRILANDPELTARAAADLFMAEMNDQAKRNGMTHSNFVNPDGFHHDDHYTSFGDLVILGKLVLENETIMKYAAVVNETLTLGDGREIQWKNTNSIINPDSDYYCPYAIGLKTGQTSQAGSCLMSAFECNGRTLLIGVFGCPGKNDRFPDTLQLFNEAMGFDPLVIAETTPEAATE